MHIETSTYKDYKLAKIEKPGALTVSLLITADCFTEHTAKTSILQHLYTDVLMAGANGYSRSDFQHALNSLGSTIEVTASNFKITIAVATPKTKLAATLSLLTTMLQKPTFAAKELKRAVITLENALELAKEDARGIALTNLKNSFYEKDDRQHVFTLNEQEVALKTVTVADIKNLHQIFSKAIWTVSVGGSKESISICVKTIDKIKPASQPISNTLSQTKHLSKPLVAVHEVKSKQNIEISIGGTLPLTLDHKDTPAFIFGLAVLGKWGGFSGRLMSTVRHKEGLTYMIYARTENITIHNTGYWRIVSFFAPKDVIKAIASTKREIELIVNKGITQSEFERFKTIIKTGDALVFDSLSGTTALVHSNLSSGLLWNDYQTYKERFQKCTRAEVNSALKNYMHPETLMISAAGPIASVKKELLSLAK